VVVRDFGDYSGIEPATSALSERIEAL